ncbi:MAG: sugar 3,4-ketoisomerase [Enterobacter asburiae]|uniref:sugar 3,4-ketoisomerase n=1 Tax=Enterobacter asburiae TaxID=61645 RepID=UPI0021D0F271|nr:FdtA/QdtA family cupin domain-containing protein [Enterobacter asburiae]MCU6242988.1 FdtA/QdtA family cupin domain-containing protein [Enterobacter asburiae]HDX4062640.1 FdtA/QdtA family cupin domain-containing protein [Enterobacter asburiae]
MNIVKIPLQMHGDERGLLVAIEENRHIPFNIKRVYYMYDTQEKVRRGYHAHKKTTQVAIVLKGSCKFLFDDGYTKQDISLDNPAIGLLIEPLMWHEMYDFSDDCILMVLADDFYDESDYIRNYDDFVKFVC